MKTKLYNHQQNAVNKIINLDNFALYMEMGTGKTRTVLEYIYRKKINKIIYFCPVSLKKTVENEVNKHSDYIYYAECGKDYFPEDKEIYIIGIESINSDRVYLALNKLLESMQDYMIIIDESSYIKGFFAKRTHRIINISKNAKYKAVMTGTPLTQYYQDIFMQFKFLDPLIIPYKSYMGFCDRYLKYDDKYKDRIIGSKNIEELLNYVSPYIFQVKLNECVDLPEKIEKYYYYSMDNYNIELYKNRVRIFLEYIHNEDNISSYDIFNLYSDLQKIVSKNKKPRLELLNRIIQKINGIPAIYCKYIQEVEDVSKLFNNPAIYTGEKSILQRTNIINNINNYDAVILTFGVGSFGLNLQDIHNCIFYSNVFKYGEKLQAAARFHRIGQKKNVVYNEIICNDTIDEKILSNLNSKEKILNYFERYISNIDDYKIKM